MPLAPLATMAGAWLVRRMRPEVFYPFTYATVALIAVKLLGTARPSVLSLAGRAAMAGRMTDRRAGTKFLRDNRGEQR